MGIASFLNSSKICILIFLDTTEHHLHILQDDVNNFILVLNIYLFNKETLFFCLSWRYTHFDLKKIPSITSVFTFSYRSNPPPKNCSLELQFQIYIELTSEYQIWKKQWHPLMCCCAIQYFCASLRWWKELCLSPIYYKC